MSMRLKRTDTLGKDSLIARAADWISPGVIGSKGWTEDMIEVLYENEIDQKAETISFFSSFFNNVRVRPPVPIYLQESSWGAVLDRPRKVLAKKN